MADGPVSETRVLLDGFGMGESPRWHEGRLWFSDWGTREVIAVDLDGDSEVILTAPFRAASTGCPTGACSSSQRMMAGSCAASRTARWPPTAT